MRLTMTAVLIGVVLALSGCIRGNPAYGGAGGSCPRSINAFKSKYCGGSADAEQAQRELAELKGRCGGPKHQAAIAECEGCLTAQRGDGSGPAPAASGLKNDPVYQEHAKRWKEAHDRAKQACAPGPEGECRTRRVDFAARDREFKDFLLKKGFQEPKLRQQGLWPEADPVLQQR